MAAKSDYILAVSFAVTILALLISVQTVSITPGFVAKLDIRFPGGQPTADVRIPV